MKRGRRFIHANSIDRIIPALAALLAVLSLLLISCSEKKEEALPEGIRPVKTVTVKAGGELTGLRFPGKVRATQRVNLAFKQVSGRLIQLPIEGREGERVQKGELLARIDPKDFRVRLQNAEGQLHEAEASLKLAQSEYDRVQRIREQDPGAVSMAMVDRKREALAQSQGRIKSLQASVDDAKNKLMYTWLRAPFTGLVAKRYVDNFQEVKPKQSIVSLQDITSVEILLDVPENIMALVRGGKMDRSKADATDRGGKMGGSKAAATFPTAPGKQFSLSLKEAATDADPATQTYQVVLVMPQPEGINVLPGMTATVTVSTSDEEIKRGSIEIPAIAIVADPEGNNYVWVVDMKNMIVHKKVVTVGSVTGSENIDIVDGLAGGETVVVAGVLSLQEGQQVSLWEEQQ